MNRFRFRFKTVLRYREILEDNKKRELGVVMKQLNDEVSAYRGIEKEIADNDDYAARHETSAKTRQELISNFHYQRRLDHRKKNQHQRIAGVEQQVAKKRGEFIEARKNKRIFERLEERDRDVYDDEVRKEEQAFIDDVSGRCYSKDDEKSP